MHWSKVVFLGAVLLAVVCNIEAKKKRRGRKFVFQVQSPAGPQKIKSFAEAQRLCRKAGGASVAKEWQLRDAVRFRQYGNTQCGCGWIHKSRNSRPRCGNDPRNRWHFRCKSNPADEGKEGYDAYCMGWGPPAIPPDAIPINHGKDRGYVFIVKKGDDTIIPTESKAKSACGGRQATLATVSQVRQAWFNGFSQCTCAWMVHYQSRVMNDVLKSCGSSIRIQGCHHGELYHALCFVKASQNPLTHGNKADFSNLKPDVVPIHVERGATMVNNGYVYPTMSTLGNNRTPNLFWAYKTCKEQGAKVATPFQLKTAYKNGMTWCDCGFVWTEQDELKYGVMVKGKGAVMYPTKKRSEKCGQKTGVISCPLENANGEGYDVFCFKECPKTCPSQKAWKIPHGSVPIRGGRVYHAEHRDGKYKITSKWFANQACEQSYNGQLASKAQLEEAQQNGMTVCRCGWTTGDGKTPFIGYPMFRAIQGCGGTTGVLSCPANFQDIPNTADGPWDAYCFISDEKLA